MLELYNKKQFKKDLRTIQKRNMRLEKLWEIIDKLLAGESLPMKCNNHKLTGNWEGLWECHMEPDWLLIYLKTDTELILVRTGSHSDLF